MADDKPQPEKQARTIRDLAKEHTVPDWELAGLWAHYKWDDKTTMTPEAFKRDLSRARKLPASKF